MDLYKLVPANLKLQRQGKWTFGQLEVLNLLFFIITRVTNFFI